MRRFRYVVIHVKGIDPVGVFPASTREEALAVRDKIQDTQNFGFHDVEQVWIWNIETNEQED